MERLQKYIASCGVTSRRKAEEMILAGMVQVNGKIINELGFKVDGNEEIKVDGKIIGKVEKMIYIKLNKPIGIITSVKDQYDRATVVDVIGIKDRIYPVGRLDYDTSGFILLTNDGDLANRLMHPKFEVDKVYEVTISGKINGTQVGQLERGVDIGGFVTSPAKVEVIKNNVSTSTVKITIHEGKNRQVRKMFDAVGKEVLRLKRIEFGELTLKDLRIGEWKYLSEEELEYLNKNF